MNTSSTHRNTILVIGYGNPLRGDDGIGQQVAEAVEVWNVSHVRSIAVHQLTPELAAELSQVDCAIFVDACIDSNTLRIEELQPNSDSLSANGHFLDPRSLLSLAAQLYGNVPQAWLIAVPGTTFEFSDRLSATAQQGVNLTLETIWKFLIEPWDTVPGEAVVGEGV